MSNAELIELFDEAIGNAKCIGFLDGMWQGRGPWPEQDYRGIVALEQANSSNRKKLSDALELADKRIAELEALLDERHGDYRRERDRLNEENSAVLECLKEAERKLNPRRWTKAESDAWHRAIPNIQAAFEALAQIGGDE